MKTTLQNVESVAGYNHPAGIIAGHSEPLAPLGNENKSKFAAMSKASQMKRASLRAAGLDHPDTVEIAGRVYDLRKMRPLSCERARFCFLQSLSTLEKSQHGTIL